MRVLTYNIRLGLDSSLERISEVIRTLEGDLVCLQEVGRYWEMGEPVDMRSVLSDATGLPHAMFAPAIQRGQAQYGIALLSRYPLGLFERIPLPRRTDEPRVLLGCTVRADAGNLIVLTSHFSVAPEDRPDQFHALTRWVLTLRGRHPLPMVVAGDFNASPDESGLGAALGWTRLRPAHLLLYGESPPTYPTDAPALAIDHILVGRDVRVEAGEVAHLTGSDHLPVWAEIDWG